MNDMQQWISQRGMCYWWRFRHPGMPATITEEEALRTEREYIMQHEELRKHFGLGEK